MELTPVHPRYVLVVCLLLISNLVGLVAQIPELNPDREVLQAIIAEDARDLAHFNALYALIKSESSVYPDTLLELYPLVAELKAVGQELGHPYDLYALAGEQMMYAIVCPRLYQFQRDSALILFHQIKSKIGVPSTKLEAETLLQAHVNMFTFCVSSWSRDSALIVAKSNLEIPLLSDSARVIANMYYAVSNAIYGDTLSETTRALQENNRLLENLPEAYDLKYRFYELMASFHGQFSGDQELVLRFSRLSQQALKALPFDYNFLFYNILRRQESAYFEMEQYDSTLITLDTCYAFILPLLEKNKAEYEGLHLITLSSYLRAYYTMDSSGAEGYLQEGLDLIENSDELSLPDNNTSIIFRAWAGAYLAKQGKTEQALALLRQFSETEKKLFYRTGAVEARSEGLNQLALLEADAGNFKASTEAYAGAMRWTKNLQESMANQAKAQAAYSLEVAETNLARQRARDAANVAEEQAALDRRNLLLGALAALAILAIVLWAWFSSRKYARKIAAQKIIVEQSLGEKEVLLREIHHRVKNNLQIISGMLTKQARLSADPGLQKMVDEGRERIESMALIHQNLYESDQLSGVNIRAYLEELSDNIIKSQKGANIELDLKVSNEILDLDTAIPVGLMLNELLTNSYKYAFPEDTKGKVTVALSRQEGDSYEMRVTDNGTGITDQARFKSGKTLGVNLIRGLARQLRGSVEWLERQQGTEVLVRFKAA